MIYAKISRAGSAALIAPILEASWPQEEPACALYPAFFGGINGPAGGGHFLFFFLPLLHGHSGILVPFAIYGTFETLFFSSSPPFSIYFRLFGGVYVWRIKMIREFNRSLSNRDS